MIHTLFNPSADSRETRIIYLLGNPNVGKSTVFNALTGLRQHTGNWSGKTVDAAYGVFTYDDVCYRVTDLPGTHSVKSCFSEEKVAGDEIGRQNASSSLTVIIANASCLKRDIALALEYIESCGSNAALCVNLWDIAKKRGIKINLSRLEAMLGIPVIGITAKKSSDIKALKAFIRSNFDKTGKAVSNSRPVSSPEGRLRLAADIASKCTEYTETYIRRDLKIDRILTSKKYGIPIMIMGLAVILWITVCGANYPSELLSRLFSWFKPYLNDFLHAAKLPDAAVGIICDGIYQTVTWIIAVMLPPMAIFFPLFTLLEDLGVLPRIAFNLDKWYAGVNMSGKQCLTQCMGLGCNAVGVTGARIMAGENQRKVAILTNSFMPCNGRFALLISLSSIFIGGLFPRALPGIVPTVCTLGLICLSVAVTWPVSYLLTKTICKTENEIFTLELPEYRKPEIIRTLAVSLVNRTAKTVCRAIAASAPAGVVIWLMANIQAGDVTLLTYLAEALNPIGHFLGVDGFIILAFILSLPANEITLPILVMGYLSKGTMSEISDIALLKNILTDNGWTLTTAVNMMVLTLFHSPCATTLMTIYHETKNKGLTALSAVLPCAVGIILCLFTRVIFAVINYVS